MNVERVDPDRYAACRLEYRTVFEKVEFNLLNKHKCDDLHFLLFNDGEVRLGLIAGVRDGALMTPFSAPYSNFSLKKSNPRVLIYYEAVSALIRYCKAALLKAIQFTLPPLFYDEGAITLTANALFASQFLCRNVDLNYHYVFSDDDTGPDSDLFAIKAAPKTLRSCMKQGLSFFSGTTEEMLGQAYEAIRLNKQAKGYPMHLSLKEMKETASIVPAEYFLVKDSGDAIIASAICFHTAEKIAQVIYWGNVPGSNKLKPMNYLAAKIFSYFHGKGFKAVDIGPATENSIANHGLCDFKRSLGCTASVKLTLRYKVT